VTGAPGHNAAARDPRRSAAPAVSLGPGGANEASVGTRKWLAKKAKAGNRGFPLGTVAFYGPE
jgi:hypothetical protein